MKVLIGIVVGALVWNFFGAQITKASQSVASAPETKELTVATKKAARKAYQQAQTAVTK